MPGVTGSLFLLAAGGILDFSVLGNPVSGLNVPVIGIILMGIGALILAMSVGREIYRRNFLETRVVRDVAVERRAYRERPTQRIDHRERRDDF
jgi:hypothetical protein